jgi:putative flippase GtrA
LAAAGTAFAQSTATISGTISVGVLDSGAAGAKAGVATLGGGANAINIVTAEDLGGGLRGGFDSQIRFNAATGDTNSRGTGDALFHGANVYLGGGFGTVRMGKIIEASNCAFDPWACTGGAGLSAGNTTGGLIAAQTQAQSVSYTTPTINGFSASYQATVSARNNERSVVNLGYNQGPLSVQFLQSKNSLNVAPNGTTLTTALLTANPITDAKAQGTSIGASYNFGLARLSVFNAKTKNAAGATTVDLTGIGATVPMGAYTILAGYTKDKKAASTADTRLALGANYALSKRTTLGADVFKQDQVGGSTGFVIRARHTF